MVRNNCICFSYAGCEVFARSTTLHFCYGISDALPKSNFPDYPFMCFQNSSAAQLQQQQRWYKISGAISRPTSHAGARYELFKLASYGGFYPPGFDADTAFETATSSQVDHSILKFSVVFKELEPAAKFIEGIRMYLLKNDGCLKFLDDEGNAVEKPTVTEVPPFLIALDDKILKTDYKARPGEVEVGDGSPLIDMVVETRLSDMSSAVTLLSRRDPTFQFQRIESAASFAMADAESAHIFPRAKCTGEYAWLAEPGFNRLALSRDVHLNFDGTARGRGRVKRRKSAQTFAIRPLRPADGFLTCDVGNCPCYKIPLELVLNENGIADAFLTRLGKNAALTKNQDTRWTIAGTDVKIFYPRQRPLKLVTEKTDDNTTLLVTAIPGVGDIKKCWSNSETDLYTVEAAEVLEKCLLWNYNNALEDWRLL